MKRNHQLLLGGAAIFLMAGSLAQAAGSAAQPTICDRTCWSARNPTSSASQMSGLNRAIIHHSASSTDYNTTSLNDSKAKVRAHQDFHMDVNGWSDIGYHFLTDKLGNIFEGREGSISSLPRGAHDGTNTDSFGFNMMGYFHSPYNDSPTQAHRDACYDVIAWRIPDPFDGFDGGSYGSGSVGYLGGHRDVKATACPGDLMYNTYIGGDWFSGEARTEVNNRITGGGGPGGGTDYIVDNDEGSPNYTETGAWTTSGATGYNAGTYRFASVGSASTATWTANLPSAGNYEVSVIYVAGTNRATSTKYDIATDSGTQTVFINQTQSSLAWVSLGTYSFAAGNATITLDAAGSSGNSVVIADAIKFTGNAAPPDTTPPADPTGLGASAGDGSVSLDWADNGESDLDGYNVYRSTSTGGPYSSIATSVASSAYVDNTVTNGTTYYYVVTAVDTSANESGNSNEASATPQGAVASTMSVSSIVPSTNALSKGFKEGVATVTILDNLGNPVANATVSGTFTGDFNESGSANTDGSGVAVITTATSVKGGVSFTFCVDNVSGSLTYDSGSNVETCDGI